MTFGFHQLQRGAAAAGFPVEPFEKALRLIDLLVALRSHPFLAPRIVLKGGAALNLFYLDLPRLSVDIDLNYIGASDRKAMLGERERIEHAVRAACERERLRVRRVPEAHAGGKWRLSYQREQGGDGTLELDVSFVLRKPLWSPTQRDSLPLLGVCARDIPVLDLHEIAAGKLAALFSRSASRDLYDVSRLLELEVLDAARLRLAFVVYGAMSRRDWRSVSIDEIRLRPAAAARTLLPLLRANLAPPRAQLEDWCGRLVAACREKLEMVLPLRPAEVEFLARLNVEGDIRPELLTDDEGIQHVIRQHPAIAWKALNVRRCHRNAEADDGP